MSNNPNLGNNPTERIIRQEETVIRTVDQNLQNKQSPMLQTQQSSSTGQSAPIPRPSQQSPGEIDASKVGTRQFTPINQNVQVPVQTQQATQLQQQQPNVGAGVAGATAGGLAGSQIGTQQQERLSETSQVQSQQLQGQQTAPQMRQETVDKNPFNLMVRDHAAILAMVRDWLNRDPFDLRSIEVLRNDISRAIHIHNAVEDEFIHPLYERYIGAGLGVELFQRSQRSDELIMNCLRRLESTDLASRQGFESTLGVMRELEGILLAHFDEEEREAFPALMSVLQENELVNIFDRIMSKKDTYPEKSTMGGMGSGAGHHKSTQPMKDIIDKTKEGVQRLFGHR